MKYLWQISSPCDCEESTVGPAVIALIQIVPIQMPFLGIDPPNLAVENCDKSGADDIAKN